MGQFFIASSYMISFEKSTNITSISSDIWTDWILGYSPKYPLKLILYRTDENLFFLDQVIFDIKKILTTKCKLAQTSSNWFDRWNLIKYH